MCVGDVLTEIDYPAISCVIMRGVPETRKSHLSSEKWDLDVQASYAAPKVCGSSNFGEVRFSYGYYQIKEKCQGCFADGVQVGRKEGRFGRISPLS